MNPYPTRTERAFERFCEDDLVDACWDEFLSNDGDPFGVFGEVMVATLRSVRTGAAFEDRELDAVSEQCVVAMEDLARSVNMAVRRGQCEMLGEVESWMDLDLWWANEPLLPRPVKNAVGRARGPLREVFALLHRRAEDCPQRIAMDEAVRRSYEELVTQLWWQDHPGPRAQYAYGYTE